MKLEKISNEIIDEIAPCYYLDEASSSLDVAYKLYQKNNFPPFSSVLVGKQTKGRGQRGHIWQSDDANIYAAIRLPKDGIFNTDALAPILGTIIVDSLFTTLNSKKKFKDVEFYLKWTNDILLKHCNTYYKIGGMLIEEKDNALFAGIGINIKASPILSPKSTDFTLSASHLEEFYNLEEETVFTIWSTLVYSIYLCYKKEIEKNAKNTLCLSEFSNMTTQDFEYFAQKNILEKANNYLAFANEEIQIIEAMVSDDFDYDENNEIVQEYYGVLKRISTEKQSFGGIVIDVRNGEYKGLRTFLNGRIKPLQ